MGCEGYNVAYTFEEKILHAKKYNFKEREKIVVLPIFKGKKTQICIITQLSYS